MNSSANNNQTKTKTNQNIQVYVRVRPLNARERTIRSQEVVEVQAPREIVVRQLFDSKTTKKFTFDRSFGPDSRQAEVYHTVVAPLIEEVLAGYNCTVFAYGQTGTGKTHTMIGTENPELKSSWEDESMIGIIPRALSHLFDELRMMEVEFSMRISYLEIYNEELCDLLSSDDTTKIRIFDDSTKKGSIIVQGLEEIPVHSKDDVYKLLEKGKERRKTATTLMNAQSSRSHTVFSILVHIKENGIDGEEMLKIGKLNLVDLAGSENISKAGNEKGIRTRETVNINQSLLTLGRVITALVERTPHVPYRESKLTRLLQESLGGRTKTSIIATISPGHKDLEETLSTLDYAHRAKNIQNKPEINQKLTKKTVLKEYTEEIDRLKRDLMAARDKNGIYLAEETYNDMQYKLECQNKELNEKVLLLKVLKDELANKEKMFNEVSLHLIEKSKELMDTEKTLTNTKTRLDETKKVLTKTKQRVEEKKCLVESHVKTEKILTEQATKLIEVADVATSDTHHLHNTIERRKNVDVIIQSACEKFAGKMENLFDDMKEQLNTLTKEHKSYSQIIAEEIGKNSSECKKLSSNATNKINAISKQCMESLSETQTCRDKYSAQFADADSKYRAVFYAAMNELKGKENDFKSILEKHFTEMLELVNQQNAVVTNGFTKVVENITNHNKNVVDFVAKASSRLGEFKESVVSSIEDDIVAVNSAVEACKKVASDRQTALENFLKQMHSFDEKESMEKEKIKTVVGNMERLNNRIEKSIDSEITIVQTLREETQASCEGVKETTSNMQSEINDLVGKCSDYTKVIRESVVHNAINRDNTLANLETMTEEHVNTFEKVFGDFKTDQVKIENDLKQKMNSECACTTDLISKASEQIMHHQAQYRALNKSLQSSVQDYSTNYDTKMTDCLSTLRTFKESELKTYTPTGQTPSRKEFSYPRSLAATSPHVNILRRFRLERDCSDVDSTTTTIAEDSELNLADISCEELGINSTPIKSDIEVTADTKLRDIKSEFNYQTPPLSILNEKSQRSCSSASQFDQENKENCIV